MDDRLIALIIVVGSLVTYFLIALLSGKRKKKDTTDGSSVDDIPRLVELSRENEALKTELSDANRRIASLRRGAGSATVDTSQLRDDNEALQSRLGVANDQIEHWRQKATQTDELYQQQNRKNETLRNELSDAEEMIDTLREKILSFPAVTPARYDELKRMSYRDGYLRTTEWKQRADIMKKWFGYRCQGCNCSKSERQLEVHHRTYERRGNENPKDLTVLCWKCHEQMENNRIERGNE